MFSPISRIQETMQSGAPMDIEDNTDTIDASLEEWNDANKSVDQGGCGCRSAGLSPEGIVFFGALFGFAFAQRRRRR